MRTKLFSIVAGAVIVAAAAAVPAVAHHSFAAEFDAKKPVKLRGTVKKMEWINPHSWIHIDVKNADGTVTTWMVEGGAPNALIRRGWNRNSLPPGTEILVEGFQAYNFIGSAAFSGTAGEMRYQQAGGQTYVQLDVDGDGDSDLVIRIDGLHDLQGTAFII